jgi:uncharacterized membrane protein
LYFSFFSLPAVKPLKLRDRLCLYRKINAAVNLGRIYALGIVVSFGFGILVGGFLAARGITGDVLGYLTLGSMVAIWMPIYLYILNRLVHPTVAQIVREEKPG